jgi:hypothetical protein
MGKAKSVKTIGGGVIILLAVALELFGSTTTIQDAVTRIGVPVWLKPHVPFIAVAIGCGLLVWRFYTDKLAAESALESERGGVANVVRDLRAEIRHGERLASGTNIYPPYKDFVGYYSEMKRCTDRVLTLVRKLSPEDAILMRDATPPTRENWTSFGLLSCTDGRMSAGPDEVHFLFQLRLRMASQVVDRFDRG